MNGRAVSPHQEQIGRTPVPGAPFQGYPIGRGHRHRGRRVRGQGREIDRSLLVATPLLPTYLYGTTLRSHLREQPIAL